MKARLRQPITRPKCRYLSRPLLRAMPFGPHQRRWWRSQAPRPDRAITGRLEYCRKPGQHCCRKDRAQQVLRAFAVSRARSALVTDASEPRHSSSVPAVSAMPSQLVSAAAPSIKVSIDWPTKLETSCEHEQPKAARLWRAATVACMGSECARLTSHAARGKDRSTWRAGGLAGFH